MQHIGLLIPCLIPIAYLVLSFLSFHLTLHSKNKRIRLAILPAYYWFSILSFVESKRLRLFPGLTSLWAQSVALNVVHITSLLFIERWPTPQPGKNDKRTCVSTNAFHITYRLWSNPRLHQVQPTAYQAVGKQTEEPLPVFLVLRISKILLYCSLHVCILPALFSKTLGDLTPEDVAEPALFSRLADVTAREALVRAYFAISWIWESFAVLDGTNALLAIIAVLTSLDQPSDWPPLFGSPMNVCRGLRGFWSGFWHRLARRPYTNIGRLVARFLGLLPANEVRIGVKGVERESSKWKKKCANTVVAFTVFAISGLAHAAVSWRLGAKDWWRDGLWFMLNFAGCMLETIVKAVVRCVAGRLEWEKELQVIEQSWLGKVLGYSWVLLFFSWSVPLWKWSSVSRGLVMVKLMRMLMSADEFMQGFGLK